MKRTASNLDLIANAALAGAAFLMLVRPKAAMRISRSPLLPQTQRLAAAAARRLAAPAAGTSSKRRGLARLVGLYTPSARPRMAGPLVRLVPWLTPPPRSTELHRLARLASGYSPWTARRARQERGRTIGHRLNDSAGMLAFSVLADSAVEHYRGSFQNRTMYVPLMAAALTLGGSLFGSADLRIRRHAGRDLIYAAAAAVGSAGLAFHTYNILKRPGQWSWLNLFYAAPIGAPMALVLAGLLGRGAERVRDTPFGERPTIFDLPAGRMLAGVAALGLAGTVGEVGLLHFRGAYHNPAMILPVSVPPVAAALLGASALRPNPGINRLARWWLRLTALLGFAGVGFHVYGVSRNMGGWRNWSQNVLNGPPLPAPPSFTGLSLAGLAALSLIEEDDDG